MFFFDTHEDGCELPDSTCIKCRLSNYLINTYGYGAREIVEAFLNGIGKPYDVAALGEHVGGLGLSKRTAGPLNLQGIRTLRELVALTEYELLQFPFLNRKRINEIKVKLAERDLHLGMNIEWLRAMDCL